MVRRSGKEREMKVAHSHGTSLVTGKVAEMAKIQKWIALANCEIMVDECDDDETCFVVVSKSRNTTQAERQADFQAAKKLV
jgi:hypothetical protein